MTATAVKTHVVAREERASAKAVFDLLARADPLDVVKLVSEPLRGPATSVPISKSLVAAIRDLSGLIQSGEKVGIFADDPEVSPEQASDMLGLSRPTIVQRIKRGDLKARMVGAHHRIRMSDLIAFQRQELQRAHALAKRDGRAASMRFAVASTAIEGGTVLPETEALLEGWVEGRVSDDELMDETLRRFGPGA